MAAATKVLKNLPKINVFVVINHKFLDNDRASFDASYAFCVLCFIISSFFYFLNDLSLVLLSLLGACFNHIYRFQPSRPFLLGGN